jgi:hypothetical protein
MTMTLTILISCAVTFTAIAGLLLHHGRHGQRGLVWTMRMGEQDVTRYE